MSNVHQVRAKELFEGFRAVFRGEVEQVELSPFPKELTREEQVMWNEVVMRYWREFCSKEMGILDEGVYWDRCVYWQRMLRESTAAGFILNLELKNATTTDKRYSNV